MEWRVEMVMNIVFMFCVMVAWYVGYKGGRHAGKKLAWLETEMHIQNVILKIETVSIIRPVLYKLSNWCEKRRMGTK